MTQLAASALNAQQPWPGLASFAEADHAFFHGRQSESAELLRLVQREPLTMLFGRSGLGKTSLLHAGLFPALRADGCLPVYVRLDYDSPVAKMVWDVMREKDQFDNMLSQQIYFELRRVCQLWDVQSPEIGEQKSLWAFFHRRDALFWGNLNRPVQVVLVLDQFEEIFTRGFDKPAMRSIVNVFLQDLADLVENRPPDTFAQALERDPEMAREYDFRQTSIKLVLSFREDFLPHMEGLKRAMPSLMYNRMRLLPMDGAQAYAVVRENGGDLVNDIVARRILRLAWKNETLPPVAQTEFDSIEIDPALLSVVCSELNYKRLQKTPAAHCIDEALLQGAEAEIMTTFYEHCMEGIDAEVRKFVEENLITDGGLRDNHNFDDALKKTCAGDVARENINRLIELRLLYVDTRNEQRRLELTHDVLTKVVMASRDKRRAHEEEQAEKNRIEMEQSKMIAELEARQLAERGRVAALAALVAGVSHELNTPIGNSLIMASVLQGQVGKISEKMLRERVDKTDIVDFIDNVDSAIKVLLRGLSCAADLINSFKQVAIDRTSAQRRPFELGQTCQEILSTLENQIKLGGHSIELDVPEPIQLDAYPGLLGQVITNLVSNAIMHGFADRTGGRMRLSARPDGTLGVQIRFEDNGCGIPAESLPRIFEPFFSTVLGRGGSGLGLTISYEIITFLLGGRISVESELGKGTVFILDLPLHAPER